MSSTHNESPSVGIIGFGAFGRLIAQHLAPHLPVRAHDPAPADAEETQRVRMVGLADAARADVVVLAVPVPALSSVIDDIESYLRPGALVIDVCSVMTFPAAVMRKRLPQHVEVLATHPLFGPQSARDGVAGLNIAVCRIRGRSGLRAAAFLRKVLGLRVIMTTPEAHDREAAIVQGLTHLIAKALVMMEPLPTRMTTRSFELLMQGVSMVRYDAPEVFEAIEQLNPYAAEVRRRFFAIASQLEADFERSEARNAAGLEVS